MKEKPTTTILREARALIARPRGWFKGWFISAPMSGCYCALGALQKAATGSPYPPVWAKGTKPPAGYERAQKLLAFAIGTKERGVEKRAVIIEFNDKPKTRKKDVLAAFDRAIELSKR